MQLPSRSLTVHQNAAILARYALAAYDLKAAREQHDEYPRWTALHTFANGNAQGLLYVEERPSGTVQTALVAIAGSNDPYNWVNDLDRRKVAVSGIGLVHAGIRHHAQLVANALTDWDIPWRTSDCNIWITGHSLGGAAAAILPALLGCDTETTQITTFGPLAASGVMRRRSTAGT